MDCGEDELPAFQTFHSIHLMWRVAMRTYSTEDYWFFLFVFHFFLLVDDYFFSFTFLLLSYFYYLSFFSPFLFKLTCTLKPTVKLASKCKPIFPYFK
ncbi:MAG: hypothetical protein NUV58_01520 [Candidatus Roizmanbacteria bacterium]|nr:hypothetical protein [Candidatus Roizmanbacteria bacterium]